MVWIETLIAYCNGRHRATKVDALKYVLKSIFSFNGGHSNKWICITLIFLLGSLTVETKAPPFKMMNTTLAPLIRTFIIVWTDERGAIRHLEILPKMNQTCGSPQFTCWYLGWIPLIFPMMSHQEAVCLRRALKWTLMLSINLSEALKAKPSNT